MLELVLVSTLNGVLYGMLLFLMASGLTLIFSMMGVLNFAHASFYMLGAFFGFQLTKWIGFWPALFIAPVLAGALGAGVERFGLRRVHRNGHVAELLFTFGLAFVIEEIVQIIWGKSPVDFRIPPPAPQPEVKEVIDTSDTRFVNAGTQFGEPVFGQPILLWQTHTLGALSFAIPHAYRLDVGTNTIAEVCEYFASKTSQDFNASIVANLDGTTFIAWSSTDPARGINPQSRFTGKKLGNSCSTLSPGILDKESPQPLTGNLDRDLDVQRWGDYSAVTLDPTDTTQAWGINEFVPFGNCASNSSLTCWKSHFGSMSNP